MTMDAITSDVERNKQVVRDQIAAMERQDAAAQAALMTDDVQWWVPQSAVEAAGLARPLAGKKAVVELLGGTDAFFTEMHWTIDGVVAEGDHVAVHAHMKGRTASGNDYLNYYHFLYRLDGGLIAEVWEHVDTAYAFARMAH
jgi:ketosteroid isomerase-like protein